MVRLYPVRPAPQSADIQAERCAGCLHFVTVEAEIPSAYRPGDRDDFERLYAVAYPRVRATLTGILGDPGAAEDCAQDAFVRAFRAWSRWKPDASAEAWVHRIAVNVAISHGRRERLREILHRLGSPGAPPDPAAMVERSDLVAALRSLPPRQSAAIVLRHLHGYSNREIGVALGIPERTVASRLIAARRALRQRLGDQSIAEGEYSAGLGGSFL
jgi:RNA polymerase sigma-70 factor (ECF subfamily)